jgi:hypothetical protein
VAGQLAHPESKRRMFVIAEEYEKLAKRIVIRAKIAARSKLR